MKTYVIASGTVFDLLVLARLDGAVEDPQA